MNTLKTLAICTVVALLNPGCGGGSGDDQPMVLGDIVDPEVYRAEIQSLENSLYLEPLDDNARTAAAVGLYDLADKLDNVKGILLKVHAGEMRQLAMVTEGGKHAGQVRKQWERIRGSTFADAVWYRWNKSPQRPQVASHASAAELAAREDLHLEFRSVLGQLDRLVERGKRDVERMGEPEELTTTYKRGDYQDLAAEWEAWDTRWQRRLDSIERDLPDKPEYAEDAPMRQAHEQLTRAIYELRTMARGNGAWQTPFRMDWEQRFRRADKRLDKARYQIEN